MITVCFSSAAGAAAAPSPDRVTAIAAAAELARLHPRRHWRLICVDAAYPEAADAASPASPPPDLPAASSPPTPPPPPSVAVPPAPACTLPLAHIRRLCAPRRSLMDVNIGGALWAAASGSGRVVDVSPGAIDAVRRQWQCEAGWLATGLVSLRKSATWGGGPPAQLPLTIQHR